MEKAGVKPCCNIRIGWGKFIDPNNRTQGAGIFSRILSPTQHQRRFEINFCPYWVPRTNCGDEAGTFITGLILGIALVPQGTPA